MQNAEAFADIIRNVLQNLKKITFLGRRKLLKNPKKIFFFLDYLEIPQSYQKNQKLEDRTDIGRFRVIFCPKNGHIQKRARLKLIKIAKNKYKKNGFLAKKPRKWALAPKGGNSEKKIHGQKCAPDPYEQKSTWSLFV